MGLIISSGPSIPRGPFPPHQCFPRIDHGQPHTLLFIGREVPRYHLRSVQSWFCWLGCLLKTRGFFGGCFFDAVKKYGVSREKWGLVPPKSNLKHLVLEQSKQLFWICRAFVVEIPSRMVLIGIHWHTWTLQNGFPTFQKCRGLLTKWARSSEQKSKSQESWRSLLPNANSNWHIYTAQVKSRSLS